MKFDIKIMGTLILEKPFKQRGKNPVIGQVVRDTRLTAVRGGLTPVL